MLKDFQICSLDAGLCHEIQSSCKINERALRDLIPMCLSAERKYIFAEYCTGKLGKEKRYSIAFDDTIIHGKKIMALMIRFVANMEIQQHLIAVKHIPNCRRIGYLKLIKDELVLLGLKVKNICFSMSDCVSFNRKSCTNLRDQFIV